MSRDRPTISPNHPVTIQQVSYAEASESLQKIRREVFLEEQGIDPKLEFDGKDDEAEHFLALWQNQPVGTLRIRYLPPFTAKIERLAVLPMARGQGIGTGLLQAAIAHVQSQSPWEWIHLNAQVQVQDLYKKLGFQTIGEEFEEAGIPHLQMVKYLKYLKPGLKMNTF
jgi:predicted GNAT family N-acyltransferase